jgi:hypothetical protein
MKGKLIKKSELTDMKPSDFDTKEKELIEQASLNDFKEGETLEEAAENFANSKEWLNGGVSNWVQFTFKEGAKWQQEQDKKMYSEEDLQNAFYNGWLYRGEDYSFPQAKKEWFEQFKKK